jgi:hypothetical protein
MRGKRACAALVAACLAFSLASCATAKDEGAPAPILRGQWLLHDAHDRTGRINLLHQYLTLSVATDSTTSGRASCSDYKASILGDPRSLWVRAELPQQINCGTSLQQTLEDRYIGDLNTIRSASVARDGLHLTSPGVELHYTRVLPQALADVQDRVWYTGVVQALSLDTNSPSYSLPETGASLRLASGGLLTVSTPCGTIVGHYAENVGLVVSNQVVVKTRPKCSDDGQLLDDYLVKLIDSGFSVTSSFHTMVATSERALLRITFSQAESN